MTAMGKLGEWDEDAFQEALKQFDDPEVRARIERNMRRDKELLLRLAKM